MSRRHIVAKASPSPCLRARYAREPSARAAATHTWSSAGVGPPSAEANASPTALARAAALQPELLFLDEPSASLDPAATRAVEEIVLTLAQRGTKIVMTTHDLAQARRLAGDVVFLHRGSVLEQASAEAFFQQPASATARAFLRGELVW